MSSLAASVLGLGIACCVIVGLSVYVRRQRRAGIGVGEDRPLWHGLCSFGVENLETQFAGVQRKRLHFPTFGMPQRGYGTLEVRPEGLVWNVHSLFARAFSCAKGGFTLSWAEVAEVKLADKPGTVSALGGYLLIARRNALELHGEYLGDPAMVRRALQAVRGASPPPFV